MSAQRAQRFGIDERARPLFLELNKPSASKLAFAAQERGIPLSRANARALVMVDDATQEFAPGPKFEGKIVGSQISAGQQTRLTRKHSAEGAVKLQS